LSPQKRRGDDTGIKKLVKDWLIPAGLVIGTGSTTWAVMDAKVATLEKQVAEVKNWVLRIQTKLNETSERCAVNEATIEAHHGD